MGPARAYASSSLATITDEEILDLIGQLRLSVVSNDHQPQITETVNRLLEMVSCNPHIQLALAEEPVMLVTLQDLFNSFQVSEAALLSGLSLLQCLASGPAFCKRGVVHCTAWSQPTALLAAVVALLQHPKPAIVTEAAGCLRLLSSDQDQHDVCCRLVLQQHKNKSAATLLAEIVKKAATAYSAAPGVAGPAGRRCKASLASKCPRPASPAVTAGTSCAGSTSSSSSSDQDLSTHSIPLAAVSTRGRTLDQPYEAAVQAAATLQNLAEAAPANLIRQKGVAGALLAGLQSSSQDLMLPCLRAVVGIASWESTAALFASLKGAQAVPVLAALSKSDCWQDGEVSSCARFALGAISRHHKAASGTWMSKLCQQPQVHEL